jgi:hypothetical protein
MHKYVNGKTILVETIPAIVGRGISRMMEGINSSIIYLIYYKNICKCHNVPPPRKTKKKKEKIYFHSDL